jgi:hypothetical protein
LSFIMPLTLTYFLGAAAIVLLVLSFGFKIRLKVLMLKL